MRARQFTATGGGGGSAVDEDDVIDIIERTSGGTVFAPANKFSPLKIQPSDGYANGNSDAGPAATHDASAGAVPSYTTAKKRQICIVTVAGTLGGTAVLKGDLLMALQNSPTTAAHWAIISDCTTEYKAAVEAAQGDPLILSGTFLLQTADPDAAINMDGEYTIMNRCGYPAIYQMSNNTRAALTTPRQVASAGIGVATGIDVDDEIGTTLQQVSYFVLNTAADAANYYLDQKVEVYTDATHVSATGSQKGYISNAFVVTSIDSVGGIIYADRVVKYHNKIANATNIYLIGLHEDRAATIRCGSLFMGAPTIIGGEVGWWQTLNGTNYLAGTISGSGSTRTITYTGPDLGYIALQGVRIGAVSGVDEASCRISSAGYSAGVNTLVIAVSSTNDKGQAYTAPTSGTIYFVPAFWANEFDTNSQGGACILQQAHCSKVETDIARLWSSGVRIRFSHFCDVEVHPRKVVNIGTGISGKSWRLTYDVEAYSACRNKVKIKSRAFGQGGRHPYTSSSGTTSVTWTSDTWRIRSGCTCENYIEIWSTCDTGPAADTHSMTNGDMIVSHVEFPTTFNTAHSYRGIGAQRRCENGKSIHKQRGGNIGFRIANGSDYVREPGSVDDVDLDISDLPIRDDQHGFSPSGSTSQMPCGFLMMDQSGYTNKTSVVGTMKFKNAGCGFNFEASTNGRLDKVTHANVGYALGWVQNGADVYISELNGDYSIPGGAVSTSVTSNAIGSGSKTYTIGTGLTGFDAGRDILVQDTAAPRDNYAWGRIVSYNSGTGALVLYQQSYRGSGTKTAWTITAGAKIPRYGVVMSGTCTATIGVLKWRVGEGANPLEIFHSKDSAATKTVNVGMLIIDDPLLKGMPSMVTSGRTADFNINVGIVIYNGVISQNRAPYFPLSYRSNKYYGPTLTSASWSQLLLALNTQYFMPIWVSQPATFKGISMFQQAAGAGSTNLRVGIYKDNGGVPGALIAGTDTADTGETLASKIDVTFATPVTLTAPGWYWLSILTDAAITITATSNLAQLGSSLYGAEDIGTNSTGTGLQPIVASVTYGALPATAGTIAYGSTGTNTVALFLKAN